MQNIKQIFGQSFESRFIQIEVAELSRKFGSFESKRTVQHIEILYSETACIPGLHLYCKYVDLNWPAQIYSVGLP